MGLCFSQFSIKCTKCGALVQNTKHKSSNLDIEEHICQSKRPILSESKYMPKLTHFSTSLIRNKDGILSSSMKMKIPVDADQIKFRWIEVPVLEFQRSIAQISPLKMMSKTFQEKLAWIRAKIDILRNSFKYQTQRIIIDRENLIESSLSSLSSVNLLKSLQISFKGDKAEDVGGGLLREWMHLCLKEIFSKELGIFEQSFTDQTAYHIVYGNSASDEKTFQALNLLGLLIAKAIIQRMPINCFLDYSIIRQLCCQPVHLSDVYSFNKQLYKSWKSILEYQNIEDLYLDGTIYQRGTASSEQVQILPDGTNTLITNQNKGQYVQKLISFYCCDSIQSQINEIKKGVNSVFPIEIFSIFQPFELSTILHGIQEIDILDWMKNTVYDGFTPNDQVIQWFWDIVRKQGQQQFRNLLHYCTGSTRIPIEGFSKLENNYGHIKKFTIRKVQYSCQNPYPKSYTCFNRLDLPAYSSKQELELRIAFIMQQEFNLFGLC